jgi:phosphomannomutase
LLDRLHDIERRLGVWGSAQHSVTVRGAGALADIGRALDKLGASPPESIGGMRVVACRDYRHGLNERPRWLGSALLIELELELEQGRVLVRPSGTEPKLKVYVDVRGEVGASGSVFAEEEALAERAALLAREVVTMLGISRDDGRA